MARSNLDARMEQRYDRRGLPLPTYLAEALSFQELSDTGVDESGDYDDRYEGICLHPSARRIRSSE